MSKAKAKTKTTRYDVAEHLRTPEEMAAYLEACMEEAHGDATFVAKADVVLAVGVDAEVHEPLPAGVLEQVAYGRERAMAVDRTAGVHLDRLLFSAKEAVYKVWFPLTRRWLGFEDVELSVDAKARSFQARLLVSGPIIAGTRLTELHGQWCVDGGLVATAVVLLR